MRLPVIEQDRCHRQGLARPRISRRVYQQNSRNRTVSNLVAPYGAGWPWSKEGPLQGHSSSAPKRYAQGAGIPARVKHP